MEAITIRPLARGLFRVVVGEWTTRALDYAEMIMVTTILTSQALEAKEYILNIYKAID